MTTNRSTKENGRPGTNRPATEVTTNLETDSTTPHSDLLQETDPVIGWYGLAAGVKPSRTRQQKRGWNRSTK